MMIRKILILKKYIEYSGSRPTRARFAIGFSGDNVETWHAASLQKINKLKIIINRPARGIKTKKNVILQAEY